jgi:hypothetical protein
MIKPQAHLGSVADERLAGQVLALADFGVTVGKAAAGQADAQVGVWAKSLPDAQLGVQIGGSQGNAERQGELPALPRESEAR